MKDKINPLQLSFPNFVLGQIIDPEEANQNNSDIANKVNEFITEVEGAILLAQDADTKADDAILISSDADTKSDNAILIASTKGDEAINIATVKGDDAIDKANDAIDIATTKGNSAIDIANGSVTIANTKGDSAINIATTKGDDAIDIANNALLISEGVQSEYNDMKPSIDQAILDAHNATIDVFAKVDKTYVDDLVAGIVLGDIPDESISKSKLAVELQADINKVGVLETNVNDLNAYAVASGTNTYIATIDGYTLAEGKTVRIKFTNANTGASTLNINELGAINIIKGNGNALSSGNIKTGQICNLVYTGSVFQLLGEGGEYGTAIASNVLIGKTIGTEEGIIEGSMPDMGAVNKSLAINGSYTIPAGYHSGTGKVTQSITTKAATTYTPSATAQTISAGQYLSGIQTISAVAGLSAANVKTGAVVGGVTGTYKGYGTTTAANVLSGQTFSTASLASATGTMVNRGAVTKSLTTQGASYTVPVGYHSGTGKVTASFSNLSAGNVKSGVNVGGIIGTFLGDILSAGDNSIKTVGSTDTRNTTPTKLREIRMKKTGTYRFKSIVNLSEGSKVSAQYYVNGNPYGSKVTTTQFMNMVEDIFVNSGDLVQVYGWVMSGSKIYISSVDVCADLDVAEFLI